MLFLALFGGVALICCWWMADLRWTTKSIFTLLYCGSLGLLFFPDYRILFWPAQAAFIAVVGAATFGLDWLTRDVRR